jgi:hypothetical protein
LKDVSTEQAKIIRKMVLDKKTNKEIAETTGLKYWEVRDIFNISDWPESEKRCSEESREDERKMATTKGKTVPMRIDTCVRPVYIVEDMIRLGTVAILK